MNCWSHETMIYTLRITSGHLRLHSTHIYFLAIFLEFRTVQVRFDGLKDPRTDGRTDGRRDIPGYRVASTRLKKLVIPWLPTSFPFEYIIRVISFSAQIEILKNRKFVIWTDIVQSYIMPDINFLRSKTIVSMYFFCVCYSFIINLKLT